MFPCTPDARFPIRVFVMFLNVSRKVLHVVMEKPRFELCRSATYENVLMHFHVAHRAVLILCAALELPHATPKQRELVETCAAVPEPATEEYHIQSDVVTIDI